MLLLTQDMSLQANIAHQEERHANQTCHVNQGQTDRVGFTPQATLTSELSDGTSESGLAIHYNTSRDWRK